MGARLVKMPMNLEELATLNTIGFFVVFFIFIICLFRCLPYVPRMEGGLAIQITPKSTSQKCPEHIGEKFCCFCFIKISSALLSYHCLAQLQFIFIHVWHYALQRQYTENSKKNSQKWNCAASVPIPKFMFLGAIYIFPRSACQFCCRKIGGPIVGIYKSLSDTWM